MAPQKEDSQASFASPSIANNIANNGGADFDMDDLSDPKPKPSLSSYNMFFKLERKRILNNTDHLNLALTSEEIRAIIAEHKVQGKRAHRKTHGKIGFKELARTIAGRWKKLDSTTKALLERHALLEKEEHRKIYKAWKKRQKEREAVRARAQEAQGLAQANNNPAPSIQGRPMVVAPSPNMMQNPNIAQNPNFNMNALLASQQIQNNSNGNQDMQQQDQINRLDTLRQAHQQVEFEMKQLLAQAAAQQQRQGNDPSFNGQQQQGQQAYSVQTMMQQNAAQHMSQQQGGRQGGGFNQASSQANFPQFGGQQQLQQANAHPHPGSQMPFYGRVSPEDQFSRSFFDNEGGAQGTTDTSANGQQQQAAPQQRGPQQQPGNEGQVPPEQARMLANALSQLLQSNNNSGDQQQQQSFNFLQQQQQSQQGQ